MSIRSSVVAGSLFMLLAGCGEESAPPSNGGAVGGSGGGGAGGTPSGVTSKVINPELEGVWNKACVNEANGVWWGRAKLTIKDGVVLHEYFQYKDDSTCQDESKLAVYWPAITHSWIIGDKTKQPTTLDQTIVSGSIKVISPELGAIWNTASGCGPHALGVAESTLEKTCWGGWNPAAGGTIYELFSMIDANTFALGSRYPGFDGKTPETRPALLDTRQNYVREGTTATSDGFIEATVDGTLVRADKVPANPNTAAQYLQISAATAALPPWKTWLLQLPLTAGTFTCKTAPSPTFINYGFTQDNLPVLWDTEQKGGNDCTITVTKAAAAPGEATEGTFEGVLGDGKGASHNVTGGTFRIVRSK